MKATFVVVVTAAFAAGFVGRRLGAAETSADDVEALRRRVADVEAARATVVAPTSDVAPTAPDRRIDELESRVAAALAQPTEDASAAADVDPEPVRLRGLSDPALIDEIRKLSSTRWETQEEQTAGLERAVAACDTLLARRPDAKRRAETLTTKGTLVRAGGDYATAESLMREALALVDPTSDEGVTAGMQLAFNRSMQFDCRGAAERFLDLARLNGLSASYRAQCLHRAASFFAAAKDVAPAREHHGAVVAEFAASDDKMARYWAAESKKALAEMDAAATR